MIVIGPTARIAETGTDTAMAPETATETANDEIVAVNTVGTKMT